jgi:excinuclease ABC subunit A
MKNNIFDIKIYGAREHNLKNLDLVIPGKKLTVITGLSGSGKSSLAFDTIYAEGQRRFIETFSAYARQFLGGLNRPDVDKIDGLSPVISIEQKTTNKNPRSTVGTITEIYDFLRLLYAKASEAYSYNTGEKMVSYTEKEIIELIYTLYYNKKITILAPVVKSRKGHYKELLKKIAQQGYLKVRIDGEIKEITRNMQLERYQTHDIEIVIDRPEINKQQKKRLQKSIETALYHGKNMLMVMENQSLEIKYFSKNLMCPSTGLAYAIPEPNSFSYNSPKGACPYCKGIGHVFEVDLKKIIPDNTISIKKGGIVPVGEQKKSWIFSQLEIIAKRYDFSLDTPIKNIPAKALDTILYGADEHFEVFSKNLGITQSYHLKFDGIVNFVQHQYEANDSQKIKRWAKNFMTEKQCPVCNGSRLKKEARYFKINNKSIVDLAQMDISELSEWFSDIEKHLSDKQIQIAGEILKEIRDRIGFMMSVGLDYLSLFRPAKSLSGGESQRIRLASQIGAQLVNVLYVLDEPSIGLHQRDNQRLITSLEQLRDLGNSVIVVEHDQDIMERADYIIDMGPGAGKHGGKIVASGNLQDIKQSESLTAEYLNGKRSISVPEKRRKGSGKYIIIKGASGNNLKNINVKIPLGKLICVTGVSGSGKSTLINETLYPVLNREIYRALKEPLPYKSIQGTTHIDKIIDIDQSPIGRSSRSNPATYTGVFQEIRNLFAKTPEAQIRGYKPGRFSFNVKEGRCPVCEGAGIRTIEMNLLPDVQITCETCQGKRFDRETLEIRYKGKSISDVLEMTIDEAVRFFESIPKIYRKLKTLQDVGLGYLTLGQPAPTLSGGEAQRVKLASELSKRDTGNTLYILDEPTTGLHFDDIRILMEVIQKLVDKGNTVIIIEHNLDVIKLADHIIDLGPEGGKNGGEIIFEGTPEELIKCRKSYTGKFLKKVINAGL